MAQSSGARHDHLLQGYLAALDATRTGLHIINTGLRPESNLVPLNAWLVAGAAIESRAHPFFRINPAAGDAAALRMNFDRNTQPEADWPIHPFRYQDENGNLADRDLAFTFADYTLLIERLRHHFRLIPAGCDSDSLVPIQDYLSMGQEEAERRIPFIWAVDANARLLRLGERLKVDWDIDPLPRDAHLPALTLQPLLENAIYHGIEGLTNGGTIRIHGDRHKDRLTLTIDNPLEPSAAPRVGPWTMSFAIIGS